MDDAELPRALVKRIAKTKLSQLDSAAGRTDNREVQVSKDALLALSESARVFINYLTATGNTLKRILPPDPPAAKDDLLPSRQRLIPIFAYRQRHLQRGKAANNKCRRRLDCFGGPGVPRNSAATQRVFGW